MFAPYMDIGAFILTLFITIILAIGVKESSRMNNVCTTVNLTSVASKIEFFKEIFFLLRFIF